MNCHRCQDLLWVCEFHGTPHDGGELQADGSFNDCGGPGEPCPDCNTDPFNPVAPPGSVLLTDFRDNGLWEQN